MRSPSPQGAGPSAAVSYRDRRSGEVLRERIPAEKPLRWLYERPCGRPWLRLLTLPFVSVAVGWWQRRAWTARRIAPFAARFGIDLDEARIPPGGFASFNDFFTRRLRPGTRPFAEDPHLLCSPADGRILVFPHLDGRTNVPLKGTRVRPAALLDDDSLGAVCTGGAALVVRLAPMDYHRFHFCDDAIAEAPRRVAGRLHSVNPIAQRRIPGLLAANQRAVTTLHTEHFGPAWQVEVGAFAVGSVVQTFAPGSVERGQEKGYFQFGGSSVVLLFEAGAVLFDDDLVRDSAAGLEVLVRAGEPVGRRDGVR